MNTVAIHRAQPIGDSTPPPVTIVIDAVIKNPEKLQLSRAQYLSDGVRLADALFASLPGGTMDALLVELLSRRASLLAVTL